MSFCISITARILGLLLLLPLALAQAEEDAGTSLPKEPDSKAQLKDPRDVEAWKNFAPPKDNNDWVQLTSDEWLKGEIKVMYNDVLEFDSDELGILSLDMEDIRQIRSGDIKSLRFNGPVIAYGVMHLTRDDVVLTNGATERVFKRSELVSITQGDSKELSLWSAKLDLGFDVSGGNTEQLNYSAKLDLRRRTANNRFVTTYLGQYSRTRDTDTADNNRLNSFIDVFQTRRFFWRPIFFEYYRDPFQNIQSRYTAGAGLGYQLIDRKKTEWRVTTGPAYQQTNFVSVTTGQDQETSTPALVTSTVYETELTKRIDFDFTYSFNIVDKDSGSYTHHTIATFETELTSWLDFDTSLIWDRIQNPTANADGTVPKSDDYKILFMLGVEY